MERAFFIIVGLVLWVPAVIFGDVVRSFILEPNITFGAILPSLIPFFCLMVSVVILFWFVMSAIDGDLNHESTALSMRAATLLLFTGVLFGTVSAPSGSHGLFSWFSSSWALIALIGLVPTLYVIFVSAGTALSKEANKKSA